MSVAMAKRSMLSSFRSLPFAGQVLLAWAAFAAVERVGGLCLAAASGGLSRAPARPAPVYWAASLVFAGLLAGGVARVLRDGPGAWGLLVWAWCASYVAALVLGAPGLFAAHVRVAVLSTRQLYVFAVNGAWLVLLVSYVRGEAARRARPLGREAGAPGPGEGGGESPLVAKVLVVFLLVVGAGEVAGSVLALRRWLAPGLWVPVGPRGPQELLGRAGEVGARAVDALVGAVGVAAAIGFRCRRDWGRWLVVGYAGARALALLSGPVVGYVRSILAGATVPSPQFHWSLLRILVRILAPTAFLIGYACSARVRAAMRRPGT